MYSDGVWSGSIRISEVLLYIHLSHAHVPATVPMLRRSRSDNYVNMYNCIGYMAVLITIII